MHVHAAVVTLAMCAVSAPAPAQTSAALKSIRNSYPVLEWNHSLRTDINCDGRHDDVFTAQDKQNYYVGIVLAGSGGSGVHVVTFRLAGESQDALCGAPRKLREESLDIDPDEVTQIPEGFRRSTRCKGVRLESGDCDSFHLFWNYSKGVLDWWRL
jgi:hypothetical protein